MKNFVTCLIIAVCALGSAVMLHAASGLKLQIVNNIADPAIGAFTIKINNQTLTSSLGFRQATAFQQLALPATIEISTGNPAFETIIRSFDPELYEGGTAILTLYGVSDPSKYSSPDMRYIGFMTHEFYLQASSIVASKVNVTTLHTATDIPALDLRVEGENPIATQLEYEATPQFPLALVPKKHTLKLTPAGSNSTVWKEVEADFSKDAGKFIYILPSGFLDPSANQNGPALELIAVYGDGKVVLLKGSEQPKTYAKLQLVHASADPIGSPIDIYANGTRIADNISFLQASPYINVPAGEPVSLVIAEPASNSVDDRVLATFNIGSLTADERYMAIAHGVVNATGFAANPGGAAITLDVQSISGVRDRATQAGNVDALLFHGVTDAPAIDIVVRDGQTLASGLSYGNASNYISLAAGSYTIDVTPAGNSALVLKTFTPDLTLLSGNAVTIFATGFLDPAQNKNGQAFGLYAVMTTGTVVPIPTVAVSVSEEHVPTAVNNYPNPASDAVTVAYELTVGAQVQISVHDAAGRIVYNSNEGMQAAGAHTTQVNTSGLSSGAYMITLRAGNVVVNRPLTVTK
jgi:hypothetical protein